MSKTNTSTEVAAVAANANALPAYLRDAGKVVNQDNFDQSDVVIPRIKLLQGLSEEVELYPGVAKTGEFWFTGLDESLGGQFEFVIAARRKKYLLVAPIADGQGVLARSDDAVNWDHLGSWQIKIKGQKNPVTWTIDDLNVERSGLTKWGTSIPGDENSPPAATLYYDYLVFVPTRLDLGPSVLSLARSQIKKAKKGLNDKISLHASAGRPIQSLMFRATSCDDSADGQVFKNWQFASAGFVQDERLYRMAFEHRFALANAKIEGEGAIDDTGATAPIEDGKF